MKQCYTPRQRQFVDLAATLADEFATRAAEHDRDALPSRTTTYERDRLSRSVGSG